MLTHHWLSKLMKSKELQPRVDQSYFQETYLVNDMSDLRTRRSSRCLITDFSKHFKLPLLILLNSFQ